MPIKNEQGPVDPCSPAVAYATTGEHYSFYAVRTDCQGVSYWVNKGLLSMKRVIVFIDGLNVRFRLRTNGWTEYYDVGYLAKKLAGPRPLVHVGFYHPQPNLEQLGAAQYATDRSYLESVRKDSATIVPEGAYMAKREKWIDGKKDEIWA